jgi:Domain of unknown function (DUF4184)
MLLMPFTLSHAAAALPFRRTRLVPSALVVGCLAPDFEYFLGRHGAYGHKLPGMFTFDLPLAFAALWLFHHYAKEPLAACLPEGARQRFDSGPDSFPIRSFSRFALIVVSILVGVATHIIWDSFTHTGHWPTNHFPWFRHIVELPLFGKRPVYGILQYLSSVFGIAAILIWYLLWYRNTPPMHPKHERKSVIWSRIVVASAFVVALVVALVRAVSGGVPEGVHGSQRFMTEAALTGLPTFWIEVLIYGFIRNLNERQSRSV